MNQQTVNRYDLMRSGVLVESCTKQDDLKNLINRIRPIKTGIDLLRVGGTADGGYLLPDDLAGISACFSPGVSDVAHFETELSQRFLIPSHLVDYSVEGPPTYFRAKSFQKKYLSVRSSEREITLDKWVKTYEEDEDSFDLILQMDIEGSEYGALLACSETILKRFRILVIEFHNIESFAHAHYFGIVSAVFDKLLAVFTPVHIHPNNCCGIVNIHGVEFPRVFEMTFLRKDRHTPLGFRSDFPHVLDKPNIPALPDLSIPHSWGWT
jgi:hypothetical protein